MAVELRLYNNNVQVGDSLVLAPNVVTRVSQVLNQGSVIANANLFLKILMDSGRLAIRERGAKAVIKVKEDGLALDLVAFYTGYDSDVPAAG